MSDVYFGSARAKPLPERQDIGARTDIGSATAWLLVLLAMLVALAVRLPGVFWLVGLGATPDQSFNVDANRFIIAALNFQNPDLKPDGYPLFMTTQLYVLAKLLALVGLDGINHAVLLRGISMTYAILTLPLAFIFCRVLRLNNLVSTAAAWLLAVAPTHVLLSHAGTPDISILFIFYATMLMAVLYRMRGNEWFFYAVCALTGIALADKFFLPALVPLGLIIVTGAPRAMPQRIFLAACIGIACFAVASFFNYTPWDFVRLLQMIAYDNVVVAGGKTPLQQVGLYALDLVSSAGMVTSLLALPVMLLGLGRAARRTAQAPHSVAASWRWLGGPAALIALPLLAHALLIVTAQVHGMRHVLVLVPVVCVCAAIALHRCLMALGGITALPVLAAAALAVLLSANAALTMQIYATDIRRPLLAALDRARPGADLTTMSNYTQLRGTRLVDHDRLSDLLVTCDLEFRRYFKHDDAGAIFHAYGGQERLDFFRDLFAGNTAFRPLLTLNRPRFSLEDHLAAIGLLPELGNFAPLECRVFERQAG